MSASNHSHFILVEDESYEKGSGFGCETNVRAAVEKCLSDNSHLRRSLKDKEREYAVFKKGFEV